MAVIIYKLSGAQSPISHDKSFNNPILWETTRDGGVYERTFYLRNDTINTYATDIKVFASNSLSANNADLYGAEVFQFALDSGGAPGQYVPLLEIPRLDETQELPVWIRIAVPQALEPGPKADVGITVNAIIHNTA